MLAVRPGQSVHLLPALVDQGGHSTGPVTVSYDLVAFAQVHNVPSAGRRVNERVGRDTIAPGLARAIEYITSF